MTQPSSGSATRARSAQASARSPPTTSWCRCSPPSPPARRRPRKPRGSRAPRQALLPLTRQTAPPDRPRGAARLRTEGAPWPQPPRRGLDPQRSTAGLARAAVRLQAVPGLPVPAAGARAAAGLPDLSAGPRHLAGLHRHHRSAAAASSSGWRTSNLAVRRPRSSGAPVFNTLFYTGRRDGREVRRSACGWRCC